MNKGVSDGEDEREKRLSLGGGSMMAPEGETRASMGRKKKGVVFRGGKAASQTSGFASKRYRRRGKNTLAQKKERKLAMQRTGVNARKLLEVAYLSGRLPVGGGVAGTSRIVEAGRRRPRDRLVMMMLARMVMQIMSSRGDAGRRVGGIVGGAVVQRRRGAGGGCGWRGRDRGGSSAVVMLVVMLVRDSSRGRRQAR